MESQIDMFGRLLDDLVNDGPLAQQLVENDFQFSEARRNFAQREKMPEITEADYLRIADGLLESTIQEAFGLSRGGKPYEESRLAFEWLLYDNPFDEDYPFSYRNCCKAAGVDPDELRERLTMLKQRLT